VPVAVTILSLAGHWKGVGVGLGDAVGLTVGEGLGEAVGLAVGVGLAGGVGLGQPLRRRAIRVRARIRRGN